MADGRLHYGSDHDPGIARRGTRRFRYVDQQTGRPVGPRTEQRIAALAIPPAWTDVWIAASPDSHVQATGRDARGRKQYRYHPEFVASRSADKFDELPGFGAHLGRLRRRVRRDLDGKGDDRDRVVAAVVRLLDVASLRVGNDEYARTNKTYGLTTLHNDHATVRGPAVNLAFDGKTGHQFDVTVHDRRLARIVRRCQQLPGQHLFTYRRDDGTIAAIGSGDVNDYLRAYGHPLATAKTFRTWNATVDAAKQLAATLADEEAPSARSVNEVLDVVCASLGNTRAVCRNSYVHPAVLDAYLDGGLLRSWSRPVSPRPAGLTADERRTVRLIKGRRRS
jgi:DNA topoisomerase-1